MPVRTSQLQKFANGLIYASFFMPLVIATGTFLLPGFIFPFIVPKIVFFRSIVLLLTGVFLILYFTNKKQVDVKFKSIHLVVLGFFLAFALSTFFGVDWYRSFWDNHERMLGLFTVFHYVLFYFLLTVFVDTQVQWRRLWRAFLWCGSLVMIIGVVQKVVPDFLLNSNNPRVSATLGNAIYYSGYGLFLFFAGLFLAFSETEKHYKYLAVTGSFLGFLGILFGGTRGTLVGLFVGGLVVLLSFLLSYKRDLRLAKISGGILLSGLLLLGILFAFRETQLVQGIPGIGRLIGSSLESTTASTRVMAWRIALRAWQEYPVLGWGPNTYFYAFNQFYNPDFLSFGWGETWFDNAHNVVMNTLATQGLVGVLAYLTLFGVPLFWLLREYRRGKIEPIFFALTAGFLVAHFVHNLFVFENPTSYLYFFFFLAFVHWLLSSLEKPAVVEKSKDKVVSWSLLLGVSVVVLFFVNATNISTARANIGTLKTVRSFFNGEQPLEKYKAVAAISSPHQDDIREDIARTIVQVAPQYHGKGASDIAKEILIFGFEELEKNRKLHPRDIRSAITQAQIAHLIGSLGFGDYLSRQEMILEEALSYSPGRQQLVYMLSPTKAILGKTDEAIAMLQESIDSNPRITESWWRLAYIYEALGNRKQAQALIREASLRTDLLFFTETDTATFQRFLDPSYLSTGG